MSNRSASETSDSISLFPFLAVLLCTMGALLVLLVILVQRAAERSLLPDAPALKLIAATNPGIDNTVDQTQLKRDLAEVTEYQKQLAGLQAEANRRLEEERLRLSHAEEHTRRLQEELAKLSIAADQLDQTEKNQEVDQEQAEREMAQLEQLVADTEKQLETLRETSPGKRSYAIMPYKGPNGTYRKPIYIECTGKGVILQPEGLVLTADDFIAPTWPGNPLAAALRASREYLNEKAAKEGAPEPPDPYPLIIIRPGGIQQYALARAAITAWDSDYGYEFVDEDMKLAFPGTPDPQLARVQNHAVMISRERLLHLVQAAPSRFRGMHVGGGGHGNGNGDDMNGYGSGGGVDGSAGIYAASGNGTTEMGGNGAGNNGQSGEQLADSGTPSGESQRGNLGGNASGGEAGGNTEGTGDKAAASSGESAQQSGPNLVGARYAQQGGTPTNAPSEPLHGKDPASGGNSSNQMAANQVTGGSSGSGQGAQGGGSPNMNLSNSSPQPIAASRGTNWAVNEPQRKSVAIRRPIQVVVRENRMILTPTKNANLGIEATGTEISLDQGVNEISEQFKMAVNERIADWGLAGSGMHWRPVLELNVETNAEMTATRITHLLQNSGVEVQLPQTARAGSATSGGTVK
jgi:hypothetical protein